MARAADEFGVDLFDYLPSVGPSRQSGRVGQRAVSAEARATPAIRVTDDWPEIVPISEQETRIIEAHFADLLDELLGPRS